MCVRVTGVAKLADINVYFCGLMYPYWGENVIDGLRVKQNLECVCKSVIFINKRIC